MVQVITGADLKSMIINAAAAIELNKQYINELNVFPYRTAIPVQI